ncbi:MAG: intradiol ring-cleavage dioxygenase [Thermoleophilaceae bacterium]|nr:intradiol ring-cleavage dioxygenase [Thermoleophilaceae bacterium]
MAEHLNRREAIAGAGLVAAGAVLVACGADSTSGGSTTTGAAATTTAPESAGGGQCVLAREATEGPFYLADRSVVRADVTEGRAGAPLELSLEVQDATSCNPIENASVDIWHTDAAGAYSGVDGDTGRFMRGRQETGADGVATFQTIVPGWYQGRAVHIHVKVHVDGNEVHTGQLYFDEATQQAVFNGGDYAGRGMPDVANSEDGIFDEQGLLELSKRANGYTATKRLGVTAT